MKHFKRRRFTVTISSCLQWKDYRCTVEYIHEVPVELCRSNFIHCEAEPLVKERPKPDIILKHDYPLVAIWQNL